MREVWMPVIGFEGFYEVSNLGNVKGPKNSILKPGTNRGYKHVLLCKPNHRKTGYIHRMVLEAFCGPQPFMGAECCHNNGNKSDNRLINLRWGSRMENCKDRSRHGTELFGTGKKNSKLTEEIVLLMRQRYKAGEASTTSLAKEYNLSTHTTWCAITGKTWKHVEGAVNNGF